MFKKIDSFLENKIKSSKDAIIKAAALGDKGLVEELLDNGVDINTSNRYGQTTLMWAVMNEHNNLVLFLLSRGADVNVQDKLGMTALTKAVTDTQNTRIVKILLEKGARVDIQNKYGQTVLYWAKKQGKAEIIERLKQHGATE